MSFTPVFYSMLVQDKCWARAWLNGLPLYKSPFFGPDSRSGTINPFLVPGENEVGVEVLKTKKLMHSPEMPSAVKIELYEVLNLDEPEEAKLKRRIFAKAEWPDMKNEVAEPHRRLPLWYKASFDPGVPVVRPPWLDAPRHDFDCAGTPELRDAVTRLHRAVEQNDADGFLHEISLKLEHYENSHPGIDHATRKAADDMFKNELFGYLPRVGPLDMGELHFEPLCGGRVAFVTRHDGGYALDAVCERDKKRRIEADLLLTVHKGRWQVFA
jgi:hypothetical protein